MNLYIDLVSFFCVILSVFIPHDNGSSLDVSDDSQTRLFSKSIAQKSKKGSLVATANNAMVPSMTIKDTFES